MEEKAQPLAISDVIPSPVEKKPSHVEDDADEVSSVLEEGLKALAGRSGGTFRTAVDEFLIGEGELHTASRAALAADKKSAEKKIVELLTTKFNLPPVLAGVIAPMVIKLLTSSEKKTTRRKSKPKTSASAKDKTGAKKKKKTTASSSKKETSSAKKPKPKTTSGAKKKTGASTAKKKTSTAAKPKPKK